MIEDFGPDQRAVDDLLRADGARWRAAQPPPPEPDEVRLADATRTRRLAGWQPLAAAAAVLLLAGGVVGTVAALGHSPAVTGPDGGGQVAGGPQHRPSLREQLVRDGDLVGAFGAVVAVPGRPVRLCAPVPVADVGTVDGQERPPAYCDEGVTLVGADLRRLPGRRELDGVVWGEARIEGRYLNGTVTVRAQHGQPRTSLPPLPFPERPPCPAPAGGWARGQLEDKLNPLDAYLRAHPDRYGEIVITYPDGPPSGPTDGPGYDKTQVALVSTVIDPAAAERELRTVYSGNLCVVRGSHNRAQVDAVAARVNPLLGRLPGVISTGADYYAGTVRVELVVLDERAYSQLVSADGGTGLVAAEPWLAKLPG